MIIKEFLPNPLGKDADGEYIKLFNDGTTTADLNGWQIKDASGAVFKLNNYKLASHQELILDYKTTKITLNNNGETIFLYDNRNQLIDKLSFSGPVKKGTVIIKDNPSLLETSLLSGERKIITSDTSAQFWFLLIALGTILASMAVWLIKYYEKNFIPEQRSN